MAITVGDAVVKFLGDRSGLDKDFAQAERDTKSFAKRASGGVKGALTGMFSVAGGILAAGVVQKVGSAITGMFKSAIDYGGDATETMGKFEVTFGDASESLEKRLAGFGAEAGRSRHDLIGMAADFGAVLKGMSLTSDMAAEYSGNLAELAVDVGSFMNAQSPEVMEKFRSAMTGEYESLKSLGIVINQASVEQELLNMGIEGGAKAATEAQLVQARYNLILQKTKDAQGDAIRTSGSWANIQVRLNGIWKDFLTDVGMGTTEALAPMLGTVAKLAGDVLPRLASALTGRVLPALGGLVSRGLGAVRWAGALIGEFKELASWTREMGGGTKEVARNLLALGMQKLGLDIGQSQQVFAVIDGIQGFAERLAQSGAAQTLRDIGQAIAGFWTSLTSGDWQGALSQFLNLPGLLSQLRTNIISGLYNLGQELLTTLGTAFPPLQGVIEEWLRPLLTIGQTGFETLGQIKSGIVSALQTAFAQITAGDLGGAAETIGAAIQNAVGLGVTWFQTNVEPFAQQVWAVIQSGLVMAWSYMQVEVPILAQQLGAALNAAVTQGAAWVAQNVAPLAEQLWASIKAMAANAFARGQELAGEYGPQIGEALGNAYKAGIDWIKANVATFAQGLTESLFEIQKQALTPGNAETAGTGIGEFLGKVLRGGITALAGILSTLGTLLYEFIKGVIAGSTGEGGREDQAAGIILKFFTSVLDGFMVGLTGNPKWAEALGQWIVDMATTAVERIESVVGDWVSAGEALVLGLIEGVKNKAKELGNEAVKAVRDAINAAKRWAGIGSPSRLAASELGEPISEGISEGIAASGAAPASALTATLGAAMDLAKRLLAGIGEKDAQKLDLLARGVNTLAQALGQFARLDADGAKMPNLEVWGAILYAVIMRVIEVVQHVRKSVDDKLLKELAEIMSSLGSILSLTRVGGIDAMHALTAAPWHKLEHWGALVYQIIMRIIEVLQAVRGAISNEGLAAATSIVEYLTSLLSLMGISGIEAMRDLTEGEWPPLDEWGERLAAMFVRVIDVLQFLRGWISDKGLKAAASITEYLGKMAFLIGVQGIKAVRELTEGEWPDLGLWGERLAALFVRVIEVLQFLRGWISDKGLKAAASITEHLQKIVGLLATSIAISLPDLTTWRYDVQVFSTLVRWAGQQLLSSLNQLGDEWREAEMPATVAADNLRHIVGLLATAMDVSLPDLDTWRWSVQVFGGLLRWAGEQLLSEIDKLGEDWFDAKLAAATAAENLRKITGLLGINLSVALPSIDMRAAITAFIEQLKIAGPMLKEGIDVLRAEFTEMRKGIEVDILPEAAEAAGQLQEVFGFLNLINLFEKLQTQRKLKKGEYRTALSNVIAGFILELKNSTPILQAGLTEVEELWGDLFDEFLGDEGIIAKIKELFTGLGDAIKSAVGIGEAEFKTTDILKNLQALYNAIAGMGALTVPELPAVPGMPQMGGEGPDYASLGDSIGAAIAARLEDTGFGRGIIEVRLSDDLRAEVTERLRRLEIMVRDMGYTLAAQGG